MEEKIGASFVESLLSDPFAFIDEDLLASSSSEEEDPEGPTPDARNSLVLIDLPERAFQDRFHVCKAIHEVIVRRRMYDEGLGYAGCVRVPLAKAVAVVLRYLSSVSDYGEIGREFGMSASCAMNVIKKGVKALAENIGDYVVWPTLERQYEMSRSFYDVTRIRGAVGSIEVSHFELEPPLERWEEYVSASKRPSIVVQGIVSFNCEFIDVFVCEGSGDPSEVLEKSRVDLEDLGELFLVGNHQSYGRRESIVTPFPDGERPTWQHDRFNKTLEIVYTRSLKAFGYLRGRFPRLGRRFEGGVGFASDCVRACCTLHNICAGVEDCKYFVKDAGVPAPTPGPSTSEGRERRERVFGEFLRACAD